MAASRHDHEPFEFRLQRAKLRRLDHSSLITFSAELVQFQNAGMGGRDGQLVFLFQFVNGTIVARLVVGRRSMATASPPRSALLTVGVAITSMSAGMWEP